jgi:hypothetical protein
MNFAKYLIMISGFIQMFFSKDAFAMDVANALSAIAMVITSGGGSVPAFDADGYQIGPIPIQKKAA